MKNFFLAPFLLLIILTGCRKEPDASFDTNKMRFAVGETVIFYNNSDDAHSYEWDFGDGTTSTEAEPSKVYENTGTYTVRLTAYSKKQKKKNQTTELITITEAPFVGTRSVEGSFYLSECKNGFLENRSGTSDYELIIKKGSSDNEIIIDNLGNLGINGVRCRVTSSSFFGMEESMFNVISGQTLTDKDGRIWTYSTNDITGEFDNASNCRTIYVDLSRTAMCGSTSRQFTFSENISDCP
jgi:PKD repeat protein